MSTRKVISLDPQAHKEIANQLVDGFNPTEEVMLVAKYNQELKLLETNFLGKGALAYTMQPTLHSLLVAIEQQLEQKADSLERDLEEPN
jgi:hypothetical protein